MKFVVGCLETFFMFLFYNIIFKKNWKENILIYLLITVAYVFVSIELLNTTNEYFEILCLTIVSVIESKISDKEVILSFLEFIISNIAIILLGMVVIAFKFTSIGKDINIVVYSLILFIWLTLCSILINYIIKRTNSNLEIYLIKSKSAWYIIINVLCVYILINFIDSIIVNKSLSILTDIVFIGFVAISIYGYTAIFHTIEDKEKLKIKLEYQKVIDELINKFKTNEQEYMSSINELVSIVDDQGNNDLKNEVHNYVDEIKIEDKYSKLKYVDNILIKAIIYNKLQECNLKNIEFKYDIKNNIKNSQVNDSEISTILNNILDTAIDIVKDSKEKYIELKANFEKKSSLNVRVKVDEKFYVINIDI